MKNTIKILATLIILLLANFQLSAQVTGNVKLADIYNNLEADHSGVMVSFEPQSGGAVADTAYTNVNGDFSITLVSGLYRAVYSKPGYGAKDFPRGWNPPSWIQTPNYNLQPDVLYKLLPVLPISGHVRGTLLPFTHYTAQEFDTLIIDAGDTLKVPEGSWLSSYAIVVKGHLLLEGGPNWPAALIKTDSSYAGYTDGYTFVRVDSGGTVDFNSAQPIGLYLRAFRSNINFYQSYSKAGIWHTLDTTHLGSNQYPNDIFLDEATLHMEESDMFMFIEASVGSRLSVDCSYMRMNLELSSNTVASFTNNVLSTGMFSAVCNGIDTLSFRNNILLGDLDFKNTLSPDASYIELINNSFLYSDLSLSDRVEVTAINNLGLKLKGGTNAGAATIKEARYNHIWPQYSSSNNHQAIPATVSYPAGMIPSIIAPDFNDIDTLDIFNNHYYGGNVYDDTNYPFAVPNVPAIYQNTGDPALLDPDGTRSDRGARAAGCINLLVLQPDSTVVFASDSIYPGDANYDGVADNYDVLPIGVKYGATGPVRVGASLVWTGQYADPWNDSLASNVNIKHTDCNGDGTINYTDVNAIYQNYGLTHAVLKSPPFGEGLWLQFPSDSVFEGDTMEVKVMLGTNSYPVNNIYGLAFSITYDSVFIKPGSARMNFQQCWMGTDSGDMISFFKELPTVSRYDIALSRTDMQTISGDGQIGTLIVVVNDDIQAKDPMTLTTQMDFGGIYAINQLEAPLNVGSQYGTFNVEIGRDTTNTYVAGRLTDMSLAIYPNPAREKLIITATGTTEGSITLISSAGNAVSTQALMEGAQSIDVSALPNGLYLLKVQTSNGLICRKVTIAK